MLLEHHEACSAQIPALPKLPEVLWGKTILVSGDQIKFGN